MILNFIEKIGDKLLTLIGYIISFVLSIFFILIPTLLLNPSERISFIEKDLCLSFPSKYEVKDKYAEWFILHASEEVTFSFEESEFKKIIQVVEKNDCENGKWEYKNSTYEFSMSSDFTDENKYYINSIISTENRELIYKYFTL